MLDFAQPAAVLTLAAVAVLARSYAERWDPRALGVGAASFTALALALLAVVSALPGSSTLSHTADLGVGALLRARTGDVAKGLGGFAALAERREELEEGEALARARYAMPRTLELARGRPVDLIGVEQALASFNGLVVRGRPIAQSYSVHTPWLARENLAALTAVSAREVVLLRLDNIERLAGCGWSWI